MNTLLIRTLLTSAIVISGVCWTITEESVADIVYDFSANPITWNPSSGPLTWDADGDMVDDFRVAVVSGFVDPVSGLFVIDNHSTSSSGIEKTFAFSLVSINPSLPDSEVALLGFDFYSEKNIEVGGGGGAGSIRADVFDDVGTELVSGINISGSLGSNPSRIDLPGTLRSSLFVLAVDLDSPPGNDDAQVIIGDIIFNGGTIRSFVAVPEPATALLLLGGCIQLMVYRRKRVRSTNR